MHKFWRLLFLVSICFPGHALAQEGPAVRNETLDSVTVTGKRQPYGATSATTTLSGEGLEKVQGGTLAEMIRSVPGVTMFQTGASIAKPVVQGMHSNRILILNNGIRQEGQQWGSEHAPEIDPFTATRISVLKGAAAIRFGPDAIGGVVVVEPPEFTKAPELQGELNIAGSANGRSGVLSGTVSGGAQGLPGLGWRLQGTLKRAGNFRTADYFLENTGVKELNFSAAAGYARERLYAELYFSRFDTDLGIFAGAHIGNLSDLEARIRNGRPGTDGEFFYDIGQPRQRVFHNLLKLKGRYSFSEGTKLNVQYGLQFNRRRE
ncbi:MAG TPA: TonB-dependent receptor plug domain-containing protein, partial [Anseongella sp.]|nr:TonB-dependent receptor plug domain-containing protein [Anseongella sp.]